MNDIPASRTAATASAGGAPFRQEFPILERKTYLNSNSLGALSHRSLAERTEFERLWNELGASAWYEIWLAKLQQVRAGFGRTIGASATDIALLPSVSAALAVVAGSLDFGSRPKVVLTELDFPTVGHQFLSRRRLGLEVEIVRSPDGVEVPLEAIAEAVDERTALLVTSHVFYSSGAVQDAAALTRIAHDAGAFMFLDAYQSNGQLPIDVGTVGADFVASGALKWLCGGPGLAYLYARPDLELDPTTLSWFGAEDPFAFDVRGAKPREDARRFELGTPAVGAAYTAAGGLAIVEQVGIPAIRARNRALADDLRDRLIDAGFALHEPNKPARRSALVLARHPDPVGTVRRLAQRDVIIDHRGPCLRFSPHFYNTTGDNERAVRALVARGRSGD